MALIRKFGLNADVDSGTAPEDVWDVGGVYPFPSAADVLHVVSSSEADRENEGSGARTIKVWGLDGDYNLVTETITLTGTTGVTGSQQFLRVIRARVLTVGGSEVNVGNITIRHTNATGNVLAQIGALWGSTLLAIYTVPLGMRGTKISDFYISSSFSANGTAQVVLQVRPFGMSWRTECIVELRQPGSAQFTRIFEGGIACDEKTDIRVRVNSTSISDLGISAGFDLSVEPADDFVSSDL